MGGGSAARQVQQAAGFELQRKAMSAGGRRTPTSAAARLSLRPVQGRQPLVVHPLPRCRRQRRHPAASQGGSRRRVCRRGGAAPKGAAVGLGRRGRQPRP